MRRLSLVLAALLMFNVVPAHAIIVDAVVSGMKYSSDQAYQAFMKLKIIEEVRILKENYDASVRYYQEFQRLNKGKGFVYNVAQEIKTAGGRIGQDLERSVDRDFIHTYKTDTKVDQFFKGIDQGIFNNMKYAGDELANVISNRQIGVDIAKNANGLSPQDAANLSAKAQGIQIQMLAQIHEDNLRLIELHSLQLANDTRKQDAEQKLIESVRKSVERVTPGAGGRDE